MRNLLNPRWIFIINTLPLAVLFFLFYGEYQIIKSLLDDESIALWKSFGWTLAFLALANLAYGIYLMVFKQKVSLIYGFLALLLFIPYLYLYNEYSRDIIPWNIPQWMVSGNIELYVGTFLMPTLAYALLVLVTHFTPKNKDIMAWKSFLAAIAIPIFWYFFVQIILPLWQPMQWGYRNHVTHIIIIIALLGFLFFIIRSIYIHAIKKAENWKKYHLFWKIPITIILPLIGLLLNNGDPSRYASSSAHGLFGDFGHFWFYILAILNGILLCLPNHEKKTYRVLLFIGRSITLSFTFYFFIVFLPLIPLSVVAIIVFGVGFVMLSPILLMVIHSDQLSKDYTFLKNHLSKITIRAIGLAGFLVIPILISLSYLNDKRNIKLALEYVYSPDYGKKYDLDKKALSKSIDLIRNHKSRNGGGFFGKGQPYLSSYYNWLVLDNLTLSTQKTSTLKKIFEGKYERLFNPNQDIRNKGVEITNISSKSTFDKSQNAWKSWVDLEITNKNVRDRNDEYATTLDLPVGTWISDYYLYVGDRKEMGILSEKKSAMWLFSNIRNRNRDPGILYYLTGNQVAFRVFPFANGEVRRTGFELLHKEPISFSIDGKTLALGDSTKTHRKGFENENIVYVSASEKEKLQKVKRKPYFHFIVDARKKSKVDDYIQRIETFAERHKGLTKNAKISFVDTYTTTSSFSENWKQVYKNQSFSGGFYAEHAIKSILFDALEENSANYPVLVTVSEGLNKAIIMKDFSDWSDAYPETDLFYNLASSGEISSHSLSSAPLKMIADSVGLSVDHSVLKYRMKDKSVRYLKDDGEASILLKNDYFETDQSDIKEKDWASALTMQAKWNSQILHPEIADEIWLDQVRYSFLSKVMSPVTSYLVVETDAQKAMLKKKQKEALAGNRSLDLDDDSQRMSEPSFILLALLLGFVLWMRKRKQDKLKVHRIPLEKQ